MAACVHVLQTTAKAIPAIDCTNAVYEAAKEILKDKSDFVSVESDDERREIFEEFVRWGENRNCEPGEILPGDSDWEDINLIE